MVEKGRAALGQPGLTEVVLRHFSADGGKKGPDLFRLRRVEHQGKPKGGGQGLFGQIIVGGTEAAGGDQDIRPAPGNLHRLPQTGGIIPDGAVPADVDAQ